MGKEIWTKRKRRRRNHPPVQRRYSWVIVKSRDGSDKHRKRERETPRRLINLDNGMEYAIWITSLRSPFLRTGNKSTNDRCSSIDDLHLHVIFASHSHTLESWDPSLARLAVRSFREFSRQREKQNLSLSITEVKQRWITLTINNRHANWYGWRPISVRSVSHWKINCVCCRYHS